MAKTKEINGVIYTLGGDSATVYSTTKEQVTVPGKIKVLFKTYNVTKIGEKAIQDVRELVIEDGVREIAPHAINCSRLKSLTLPSTLEYIPEEMCCNTALTSLDIPQSVKVIGKSAFAGNSKLKKLSLHEGLQSIEQAAFYDCPIEEIAIPKSLTHLGNGAISGHDITVLDNNVYYLGKWVIGHEQLHDYKLINLRSNTLGIANYAFNEIESDYSYRNLGFGNIYRLKSISVPPGVKYIGDYAFRHCHDLNGIALPDSVLTIGEGALEDCTSISSVTVPNRVCVINKWTFKNCKGLSSVVLPRGLTEIGAEAFLDCTSLSKITIPASVTKIGENAFSGCTSLTIECEADTIPDGWDEDWNNSARPVRLGVGTHDRIS